MRKYEAVFILLADEEEESRNQIVDRLKSIIETDGSIEKMDEWGVRKLAYPINDLGEGYYIIVNFETTPEVVSELDRIAKISDSIMRYMIIREDE